MTIYEPIDYRHAIAISHKTSHGQYFEFCFRLFLFANVLSVSFGTRLASGRCTEGSDYLANFFLAIIIFKCSVCTMLASGRCTDGSDYLAIRHTSPHSPPPSMSKYPFNHILHTIINYSKTMWVQNITAAIMMFGGNLQHPDVQNTTFAIQLLFSDQT